MAFEMLSFFQFLCPCSVSQRKHQETSSGAGLPGFKSPPCYPIAVCLWTGFLTSLNLLLSKAESLS